MSVLLQLLQRIFTDGIEAKTLRIRFSLIFGIGTVVLLYALLNIQMMHLSTVLMAFGLFIGYFALFTFIREE